MARGFYEAMFYVPPARQLVIKAELSNGPESALLLTRGMESGKTITSDCCLHNCLIFAFAKMVSRQNNASKQTRLLLFTNI